MGYISLSGAFRILNFGRLLLFAIFFSDLHGGLNGGLNQGMPQLLVEPNWPCFGFLHAQNHLSLFGVWTEGNHFSFFVQRVKTKVLDNGFFHQKNQFFYMDGGGKALDIDAAAWSFFMEWVELERKICS